MLFLLFYYVKRGLYSDNARMRYAMVNIAADILFHSSDLLRFIEGLKLVTISFKTWNSVCFHISVLLNYFQI